MNLGRLHEENGSFLNAANALLAAHGVGADDPQALFDAAALYERVDALPRARAAYQSVVSDFPGTPHAYEAELRWARVMNKLGHPSTAIERLEELLLANQLDDSWALRVLSSMAPIYEELGLTRKAADIHKRIAEKSTDNTIRAKAALVLLQEDSADEGLRLASGVDVRQLTPGLAYDFMQAYGAVLLRGNNERALEVLEKAHADYPKQRRVEAVQRLLEANLVLGKTARARVLVTELDKRVQRALNAAERPLLVEAAVTWGDYLFDRGDYSGFIEAYTLATDGVSLNDGEVDADSISEREYWAANQRAAALIRLERYEEAQPWLQLVAASNSPWAAEAAGRNAELDLRFRLRPPVAEADTQTESTG